MKPTFKPIKLLDTNRITRKGYYEAEVTNTSHTSKKGGQVLSVEFTVTKGKHTGFRLKSTFPEDFKSIIRLTHLCRASGIKKELRVPSELMHKRVKLRIIPFRNTYRGKNYLNHRITRYHPLNPT